MDDHFPFKSYTIKDTDDPWISDKIRRFIKIRKAVFRSEGRSANWKKYKEKPKS